MTAFRSMAIVAAASFLVVGCSAPRADVTAANDGLFNAKSAETRMTSGHASISERFGSLDAYLAYLRDTQAPIDKPWYKEVRPGIYELQTAGNLKLDSDDPGKRTYTRDELERMFGFSR